MAAFGQAGGGAGGGDGLVRDHGVSLGGNDLLGGDDRAADGAMAALGQAGGGAGGGDGLVGDEGMSLGGHGLLGDVAFVGMMVLQVIVAII